MTALLLLKEHHDRRRNQGDASCSPSVAARRANLTRANLTRANLTRAKNTELVLARTEIVPREGEVICWIKCRDDVLVKMRVPPESKRSNALGRKCRAEWVETLLVVGAEIGKSLRDEGVLYEVGKITKCDVWCEDRLVECGGGIHFFLTREEAEAYT